MNIEELAADGYVTQRWCFAPEGTFATGDVMLAQKIALETFELDALAIANQDRPRGTGFPRRSFLCIDELGLIVLAFAWILLIRACRFVAWHYLPTMVSIAVLAADFGCVRVRSTQH
jgi:hypothetical protein